MHKVSKSIVASASLVTLTILSGAFLIPNNIFADDSTVDNVNITVPVSCSISGTGMTSHNASIINGTYQDNIGTTIMKAVCNDSNGFAIYANGYTGNTLGNNKLIGSSTASEIITGTNTSGNTSNWAMKLVASTGTYPLTLDNGFGSYSSVPASYTKVAHLDSGTDLGTNAEGATLTSTYAAYISRTQPADTYIGQVIYTLVHPASEIPLQPQPAKAGKIVYHPNASNVQGQMGDQDTTNNASATLWASNFKRTGYGFAGWNDKYDYSGNYYGPNQDITAPADVETNGLSLYAVWIKSVGSLQNWEGCNSLTQGTTIALTDERDGNTYVVAKLADDKCWMIENLRLDDSAELSSSNTHNPSLPITNNYTDSITSNHLSAPVDPTQIAWCSSNSYACINQSMLATTNTTFFADNPSSSYSISSDVYSYGNYYNWYSATAGTGGLYKRASGDICPTGWHLPIGGSSGEFNTLSTILSSSTSIASKRLRTYPNNFIISGSSSMSDRGAYGYYWTTTIEGNTSAYGYGLGTVYAYPNTVTPMYIGNAIRCISGTLDN